MNQMNTADIKQYCAYLREQERSAATIEKYSYALTKFYIWLPDDKAVDKHSAIDYKQELCRQYAPSSVNAFLAALNGFFQFRGWGEYTVKPLHIQRRAFCASEKELSRAEYQHLVETAQRQGDTRLSLLLQLIASTGIRVSEVRYITVEAVKRGRAEISLKGKIRVILLPNKLCRRLQKYVRTEKRTSGAVFVTKNGRPMDRRLIWAQMKRLCRAAGVAPEKVFPHNLRHLFARTFYQTHRDIAKLADLLGHSSVETTRLYLLSSGAEHRRALEQLRLIC